MPGEPAESGLDPRWQAIIAVGEFVQSDPEPIWELIAKWGSYPQDDLRDAIACCLLEHLLEHHFADYFPRVEERALTDPLFVATFLRCWPFGQTEEPANATRFNSLMEKLSPKVH
ncbi:MAG: hypothetical protein SFU86_13960 [Pirellulaceae bacterium]|nr:hypothetical protein [Pirellulaceae bacterium]